ncbi:MAG: hypothetical protein Q8K58_16050 [Acidimicrobiales bacterium]|nr:hypothetical protein [Acidimicrobiales bacterium]
MAVDHKAVAAGSDSDVEQRVRRERRAILDRMMAEAEEMGLYDDPPPDYRAALRRARRRRASENTDTQ